MNDAGLNYFSQWCWIWFCQWMMLDLILSKNDAGLNSVNDRWQIVTCISKFPKYFRDCVTAVKPGCVANDFFICIHKKWYELSTHSATCIRSWFNSYCLSTAFNRVIWFLLISMWETYIQTRFHPLDNKIGVFLDIFSYLVSVVVSGMTHQSQTSGAHYLRY